MDLTFDSLEEYSENWKFAEFISKAFARSPMTYYLFHNTKESICNGPWRLAYCREKPQNPAERIGVASI